MIVPLALTVLSLLLLLAAGVLTLVRTRATDDEARGPSGMAELKQLVRARAWRRVLPSLLVIGGLLGVMLFGAITLLFALEQKATGILMLAVAIFAAARVAIEFARA